MNKKDVVKGILITVAVAGGLTLAMVAPNAVQMLKLFDRNKRRNYYIKDKTLELVDKGLLKFESKNGKKVLRITEKGKKELKKYQLIERPKKKKWDGNWRIIIYDVWETNRRARDTFRYEIKNFGFKQLQKSVWIYPYDCREFVALLKADKKFGNNVRYFVTKEAENDKSLRKMFNLRQV